MLTRHLFNSLYLRVAEWSQLIWHDRHRDQLKKGEMSDQLAFLYFRFVVPPPVCPRPPFALY